MADGRQIQVIPSQIEKTAGNGGITLRGTSANLSYNRNLLQKLQAVVNKDWTQDDSLFDDGQLPVVTIEELQKLLTQVVIRFDNDPNYYTKRDYYYLIWYLCESLIYITNTSQASVDSLKALEDQIDALIPRLDGVDSQITSILNQLATIDVTSLDNRITQLEQQIQQGLLTAGSGIEIASNTINAVYTDPTFHTTVKVGGLDAGSEIKQGDKIIDILYQILSKIVDVIRTDPKVSITLTPSEAEIGDTVQVTGVVNLTDGYYDPAEQGTNLQRQFMQCQFDDPTLQDFTSFQNNGTSLILDGTAKMMKDIVLKEQVSITSANPGLMSDGNESLQSVTSFTFPVSASVKMYRNMYICSMSIIGKNPTEIAKGLMALTKQDFTSIARAHTLDKIVEDKTLRPIGPDLSVVIACPENYKLKEVIDADSGFDTAGNYELKGSIFLNCGGQYQEKYRLYVNQIGRGPVLNIASIKFEREA